MTIKAIAAMQIKKTIFFITRGDSIAAPHFRILHYHLLFNDVRHIFFAKSIMDLIAAAIPNRMKTSISHGAVPNHLSSSHPRNIPIATQTIIVIPIWDMNASALKISFDGRLSLFDIVTAPVIMHNS